MPANLRHIDLSGFYLSRYWPMPDLCRILKKNFKISFFIFVLFESPQTNKNRDNSYWCIPSLSRPIDLSTDPGLKVASDYLNMFRMGACINYNHWLIFYFILNVRFLNANHQIWHSRSERLTSFDLMSYVSSTPCSEWAPASIR
jgi:hypothetical protein